MSYQGKFRTRNYQKYKGDPTNIIYRSRWELKFMKWCDNNTNILQWASEEFFIPYRSPLDNKWHRYFPDFYMKVKESNGSVKQYVIEVKPLRQTVRPKTPKRKTKGYIYETLEYAKNQAKWKAAKEYCKDRRYEFKVVTEKELGIK